MADDADAWLTDRMALHIRNRSKSELHCAVCSRQTNHLKVLSCYHSVCLDCLEKTDSFRQHGTDKIVECPHCYCLTFMPRVNGIDGLNELPTNFLPIATTQRDETDKPTSTPSNDGDRSVVCDPCASDDPSGTGGIAVAATVSCAECKQNMCPSCSRVHGRLAACKDHRVHGVSENGSSEVVVEEVECRRHPKMSMVFYCNDCRELTCATCFVENHNGHPFFRYDRCRAELRSQLEQSCEHIVEYVKEYNADLLSELRQCAIAKVVDATCSSRDDDDDDIALATEGRDLVSYRLRSMEKEFLIQAVRLHECGNICLRLPVLLNFLFRCDQIRMSKIQNHDFAILKDLYLTAVQLVTYEVNSRKQINRLSSLASGRRDSSSITDAQNGAESAADSTKNQSSGAIPTVRIGLCAADPRIKKQQDRNVKPNNPDRVVMRQEDTNETQTAQSDNSAGMRVDSKTTKTDRAIISPKLLRKLPCTSQSVAVLFDTLYALDFHTTKLDAYDIRTFKRIKRRFKIIPGRQVAASHTLGVAACPPRNCLFVSLTPRVVCRVVVTPAMKCDATWTHDGSQIDNVSATPDGNLLIADGTDVVAEYDPDGVRLRTIRPTQCGFGPKIIAAAMFADGRIVALHSDHVERTYLLLKLDSDGRLTNAYGTDRRTTCSVGGPLLGPSGLDVDRARGAAVLVADTANGRVVMFDPDLNCISADIFRSSVDPVVEPFSVHWDVDNAKLFVCERKGRVSVYTTG